MKLIIGLGNPGVEYVGTRHNFGFMMVDYVAEAEHFSSWQNKKKFMGDVATGTIDGEAVILLKPTTYYNLVGEAALAVKQFYRLSENDILAIHDEMALPLGTVRTRVGGSDAGNNGIKNLILHLGASFGRVRIGSGLTPTHDGDAQPVHDRRDYVLGRLNQAERATFEALHPVVCQFVTDFVAGKLAQTTYKLDS